MARQGQPSRQQPQGAARRGQQSQGQAPQRRRRGRRLLWVLAAVLVLLLGVGIAVFFLGRERFPDSSRLRVVQDFTRRVQERVTESTGGLGQGPAESGEESAMRMPEPPGGTGTGTDGGEPGARRHTVQPGENLWAIARESGLVESPWEWRTIMVQNRDKISYAFISEAGGSWQVVMQEGRELTVREGYVPQGEAPEGERFAVQVAAVSGDQFQRAVGAVQRLLEAGYYAYLYRARVEGQTWYRVRVGFFETRQDAAEAGTAITRRFGDTPYFAGEPSVVSPEAGELRGENMAFGAQMVRPWVVQFTQRDRHGQALQDLREVGTAGDFAYISQARNPDTGRWVYRTRLGFFPSEAAARGVISGQEGGVWQNAEVLRLRHFEEALPGQHLRLHQAAQ